MQTFWFLVSPLIVVGLLIWHFAVLSAVQLTVRLIGAYAPWPTLRAAVVLTVAVLVIAAVYLLLADQIINPDVLNRMRARGPGYVQTYVFQQRLLLFPLAIVLTAVAGFVIIRRMLRFKRTTSAVVAAIGIGLLAAPWLVFLDLPT